MGGGLTTVVTTYRTVTLERAQHAIKVYNEGLYGCVKNPELDRQARDMFADGLGSANAEILRQVDFIGRDYGGAAGFKAAYSHWLPTLLAISSQTGNGIVRPPFRRSQFCPKFRTAATIEILYRPFVKPLHGKSHWQVLGTSSGIS